ncbi:MAG: helix-turn-helix transcriptional regulator [Candidatus Baltobacteraceae bacterium]
MGATKDPYLQTIGYQAIAQTGLFLQAQLEVERALGFADAIVAKYHFKGLAAFGAAVRALHCYLRGELHQVEALVLLVVDQLEVYVAQQVVSIGGTRVALLTGNDMLAKKSLGDVETAERKSFDGLDGSQILSSRALWRAAHDRLDVAQEDLRWALRNATFQQPGAILVLPVAARYLPLAELDSLIQSQVPLAENNLPARANLALVSAIVKQRNENGAEARTIACEAARLFAELKWPLFEAEALEIAGESERAREIYERCGVPSATKTAGKPSNPKAFLSAREQEIADCVTSGLSNAQIAERLMISTKTVEKHLSSVFAKLSIRSRTELAAFITRQLTQQDP